MKSLKITIGRHSFKVTLNTKEHIDLIERFNKQFQTYKKDFVKKRIIVVKDKLYLVCNPIFKEYYYPNTALSNFAHTLRMVGLDSSKIDIVHKDKPKRYKADHVFKFKHPLHDYQNKYVKTMTKSLKKNHTFLVDLQTGKGKGVISAKTIAELGYRTALLILPKYIDKWVIELKQYYNITDDDMCVIRGSESLVNLMKTPPSEIPKFIIFSNRTMSNYVKEYESLQFKEFSKYPILPGELLNAIRITIMLVDETHQEFHSVYKTVLATDPTLLIGLSATLLHKDKKVNGLYELLYPKDVRLSFLEVDKYNIIMAIRYRLGLPKWFRYMSGNYGYSQTKFEESVLRHKGILGYLTRMTMKYFKQEYLIRKKHGQKCLFFFGSVDMCTYFSKYIKEQNPKLDVKRFVSGDSYDEMMKADVIVSTPGSLGTAMDVPKLITVLSHVNTDSIQANLQMTGRLRKIEGTDTKFLYFYCSEIEQHIRYHDNKLILMHDRVKKLEQVYHQ